MLVRRLLHPPVARPCLHCAGLAVIDSYDRGQLVGCLSISDLRGILPEHFEQVGTVLPAALLCPLHFRPLRPVEQ